MARPDGSRFRFHSRVAALDFRALDPTDPPASDLLHAMVAEIGSLGVARALLGALEDAPRARGYERVRLDTGPHQVHAAALCAATGYVEIGGYNANPVATYWGEKRL